MTSLSADAFAQDVQGLRKDLLRYARLQLRNDTWAEDAVSETVMAALEQRKTFAGRSQLKTWLVGILKHKIIDVMRAHARECALPEAADGEADIDLELFFPDGHFRQMPQEWGDPQDVIGQQQFLVVLEACVELMPANLGRAFLMREWLELDSDEVCKELGISSTNLWVMLHRARLRLRECLQLRWFGLAS